MKRGDVPRVATQHGHRFQDFKLLESKTVGKHCFRHESSRCQRSRDQKRVPEVIDMVGLNGKEQSFPTELSGGEQQRVGIARALANHPLMLIADEPTGNLDMETSQGIMELLYDINRKGTTVIMATHARELVKQAHKRIITLDRGKIATDSLMGSRCYENI